MTQPAQSSGHEWQQKIEIALENARGWGLDIPATAKIILQELQSMVASIAQAAQHASYCALSMDPKATECDCQPQAKSLSDLLCPPHANLDAAGHLEPFDNCIACIRAERDELRAAQPQEVPAPDYARIIAEDDATLKEMREKQNPEWRTVIAGLLILRKLLNGENVTLESLRINLIPDDVLFNARPK